LELFPSQHAEALDLPDGEVLFYRAPWPELLNDVFFEELASGIAWREGHIKLFGRTYQQPRLLAWYGDPGASYRYSGVLNEPLPWLPVLRDLRERCEALTGARFNSMLANLYRSERDGMGLHADDEPELGPKPVIASFSLGESRVFRMKHRHRKDLKPRRLTLDSGSLLVMKGDTQRNWKHEVPKERMACGPRINLTFRWVEPELLRG